MKKQNRVIKKAAATTVAVIFCIILFTVSAFAADGSEITQPLINLTDIIFAVIRIIGFILTVFSGFQLATALKSHDGAQKNTAMLGIASGLIVFFLKELLGAIGISL